jgi:oligoribonuclease NrnB/cAMP/cGMP phosphodiesterase (DHH superfamily)
MCFKWIKKQGVSYDVLKPYESLTVLTDLWDTKPRDSEDFVAWKDKIEKITTLFKMLGTDAFKSRFLTNPNTELTSEEEYGFRLFQRQKTQYCKYVKWYKVAVPYQGNQILYGACFADSNPSEVAQFAFDTDNALRFVIVINMNSPGGSLRRSTHDDVKDLDLARLADQLGRLGGDKGGGHPFASGFSFQIGKYDEVIKSALTGGFTLT